MLERALGRFQVRRYVISGDSSLRKMASDYENSLEFPDELLGHYNFKFSSMQVKRDTTADTSGIRMSYVRNIRFFQSPGISFGRTNTHTAQVDKDSGPPDLEAEDASLSRNASCIIKNVIKLSYGDN